MSINDSPAESLALQEWSTPYMVDGVVYGDTFTYWDGITAERLRSRTDGPHVSLADRLCNINERLYE